MCNEEGCVYYETITIVVMVPVKVRYYTNLNMIHSFEKSSNEDVKKALVDKLNRMNKASVGLE